MNTLTRGQLARASDVGIEAIRFYERQGLVPAPARTAAGYRRYPQRTIQRLQFIRRAKSLGFSLQEIGELLALHDDEHSSRTRVKAMTEAKLTEVENKIRDLQQMRAVLADLAEQCTGTGPIRGCPIIEALVNAD